MAPLERRSATPPVGELLALAAWSALLVWRIAAVRTWYWHPDEHDNLVAGWLVARGVRLYGDLFSHHMPLPYLWVACANAALGTPAPAVQRVAAAAAAAAFLGATYAAFRERIGLVTFAALELLYALAAPLFLGHTVLADNFFAVGAVPLALYLLLPVALTWPRVALLSAAAFTCVGATAIAAFPAALVLLVALWRAVRGARRAARGGPGAGARGAGRRSAGGGVGGLGLACAAAAPFAALAAWLVATGVARDFLAQAVAFNSQVYGAYLTPPVSGPLDPVRNALGELGALALSALRLEPFPGGADAEPVARAFFALDRAALAAALGVFVCVALRRPGRALAWAAFVALTRLRGGLFHANAFYAAILFSLALPIERAAAALAGRGLGRAAARAIAVLPVLVVAVWLDRAAWRGFLLDEARADVFRVKAPQEDLVRALTRDGERIFVAPLDPLFYLDTGRDPATFALFYLPWQAASAPVAGRVAAELERNRPPLVVFRAWQPIFGRTPAEYAAPLQRWLEAGYVNLGPLAPDNPWLRDVYLERGRYAEVFGAPDAPHPLSPALRALLDAPPHAPGPL